jgi:indolepyruvate ferredoxin oxidoreductase beta subunit
VVTAAQWLASFLASRGREVVSGQLHGMAQRGGAVSATVLVDCGPSPSLGEGKADAVLGLEPVEAARSIAFVSEKTTVLMNTRPVVPYASAQSVVRKKEKGRYPDVSALEAALRERTPRVVACDFTRIAEEAGSQKALNMAMLGGLFGAGLLSEPGEDFLSNVKASFPAPVARANEAAFLRGAQAVESRLLAGGAC